MPPHWHRLRVAAELPGQAGGIARVALLSSEPVHAAALCQDEETSCLLWPGEPGPRARCLQRGQPIHLCGHGLLAAAHVWLRQTGDADVTLDCGNYLTTATREGVLTWLGLARPSSRPDPRSALARALCRSATPPTDAALAGGDNGYRILAWPEGTDLRRLQPDFTAIRARDARALIVTAAQGGDSVALRYFAPQYGNDEDAATGSACAVLADYWQRRTGRQRWRLQQQSPAGALFHARTEEARVDIGARVEPASHPGVS